MHIFLKVVLLMSIVAMATFFNRRLKWLTNWGLAWALLLAIFTDVAFGWAFLMYPLLFLIVGSILSKLNKDYKYEHDDSGGRTAVQVHSNGGPALLLCVVQLFYPMGLGPSLYILIFMIALCDTVSSELGKYFKGPTYDIVKWVKVEPGLSGGISVAGTIGGIIAVLVVFPLVYFSQELSSRNVIALGLFAVGGMMIDSILGSTIQGKYRKSGEQIIEQGNKHQLISGFSNIDNNLVNFLSIITTTIGYLIFV